MKRLALISFVFLILVITPFTTSAAPLYGDDPDTKVPTLMVQKYLSDDEIVIGNSITVYVNISNISDGYARNLTVTEPKLTPAAVGREASYETYKWVEIGAGAVINYTYVITPKVVGNFNLPATEITYQDVNGSNYVSKSSSLEFTVLEEAPLDEVDELWLDIFWLSFVLALIPLVVFTVNSVLKR